MIGLGCLKLIYNHWRLRKYVAIAATKAAQQQGIQQEMQQAVHRQTQPAEQEDASSDREVPFGIRAIESGIEVDGVWISRSNTPAPSLPDSPMSSISVGPGSTMNRTSSSSNISRLEIPQPVHNYPGVNPLRSGPSSAVSGAPFERPLPTERSSSRPDSISPDYMCREGPRGRQTYQPRRSSHLRFSNSQSNSQEVDNAAAMAALEGRHLIPNRQSSEGEL